VNWEQVNETDAIMNVLIAILGISLQRYVFISQFYNYLSVFVSIPAAWLNDKFGIRMALFISITLAVFRNCLKALMFAPQVAHWKELSFYYWLTQNLFAYLIIPIYYCLPLKVSEQWFPERERSLAWTLLNVSPVLGSAAGALAYPRYLHADRLQESIQVQAYLYLGLYAVSLLAVCLTVSRSEPKGGAPSERGRNSISATAASKRQLAHQEERAHQEQQGHQVTHSNEQPNDLEQRPGTWKQICHILTHKQLAIQLLCLTTSAAMSSSMGCVLQDILAGANLSQVFAGNFMALSYIFNAALNIVGSLTMKPAASLRKLAAGDTGQLDGKGTKALGDDVFKTRVCKLFLVAKNVSFIVYCFALVSHDMAKSLCIGSGGRQDLLLWLDNWQWLLVVVTNLTYVLVSCLALPNFNEQTAQLISGLISEATISAVQTALYFVVLTLCQLIFVALKRHSTQSGRSDYTHSILFAMAVSTGATAFYVLLFNPGRHFRRPASQQARAS